MLRVSGITLLLAMSAIVGLVNAPRALACDTSYWNVGCQSYSVGESHSAYPGATPAEIYVRVSADATGWFYGKTKAFISDAQGGWLWADYAPAADATSYDTVNTSNVRGGCDNSSSTGGAIWINCATHLG